jgi:hypothetical protein
MDTDGIVFYGFMTFVAVLFVVGIALTFEPEDDRPAFIDKGNCSVSTNCYMVGKVISCKDVTRCDVVYSDTSEIKCKRCAEV